MSAPLDASLQVGYVAAEDVYIVFSEYYGDDTVYGRREVVLPSGEPVKGAGLCVSDLIALGAQVVGDGLGATNAWVERVALEPVVPAEPAPDAPAHEAPAPDAPAEPVQEAAPEAPAEPPSPSCCGCSCCDKPVNPPYKMVFTLGEVKVTLEGVKNLEVFSEEKKVF